MKQLERMTSMLLIKKQICLNICYDFNNISFPIEIEVIPMTFYANRLEICNVGIVFKILANQLLKISG